MIVNARLDYGAGSTNLQKTIISHPSLLQWTLLNVIQVTH